MKTTRVLSVRPVLKDPSLVVLMVSAVSVGTDRWLSACSLLEFSRILAMRAAGDKHN